MNRYFASLLLLAACSSNPLEPGAGDDPGSGTKTLVINGGATAHARITNAQQPSDFDTEFNVRISLNNTPVTTGTVTITSLGSHLNLTWNGNASNGGRWEGTANGYDEVYQLDVTSGADTITGVKVDGPDIHTFTAPMAGASLDPTMANNVTWARQITADEARFQAGDKNDLTIADSGMYSMPPLSLSYEKDKAKPNTLQLVRSNQIAPAGAAAGSTWAVSVENEIDVIALACPTCP